VRNNLREKFGTTLPRFDLMAQLHRNPKGMTMSELSACMMVTGGNITAIATQLESEQLVTRKTAPQDKRSSILCLSPSGKKLFKKMALEHETWIIDAVANLSEQDVQRLHELLGQLKKGQIKTAPKQIGPADAQQPQHIYAVSPQKRNLAL
jgi:DNA-binding MarR family transcriptional regulator